MALTIETGAIVANANSYGEQDAATTRTNAKAYALARGITLDDATLDQFLILATDYLETKSLEFVGCVVSNTQPLSWPRQNVSYPDGTAFPTTALPKSLIAALYQLCIEQKNGVVLLPTTDPAQQPGFVIREQVESIDTQYSDRGGMLRTPVMRMVNALLRPLLNSSSGFSLRSQRA